MGVVDEGPQEAQPAVNGASTATRACGRTAAARYQVGVGDGTWWELGWDPPLATYYAQHWHEPADDDDDEQVTEWLGTWFAEHPSVNSLEEALGWTVPEAMRAELDADRSAWPSTHRGTS